MLDISVHSPSDLKHYFKNLRISSDVVPELDGSTDTYELNHGWINNKQVSLPPARSVRRLFEDIEMDTEFWQEVPVVPAVRGLLLRRQTRRRWCPKSLETLLSRLPRLQEIYFEPWREWSHSDQQYTDESNQSLFESFASNHNRLKRIVLFEDFSDVYAAAYDRVGLAVYEGVGMSLEAGPIREADPAVSKALAGSSLGLEHLSASFIVDAKYFFQARQRSWIWTELVSIVLTSTLLAPRESRRAINNMLRTAAAAAMKMPKLKAMELWNGGRALASVFRYQRSDDYRSAMIMWRGNWILPLEPLVNQSWEAVARSHAGCNFQTFVDVLDAQHVIRSHGDAIQFLELSDDVVHPVSLWQINKETED